jgi:hypothetical protein
LTLSGPPTISIIDAVVLISNFRLPLFRVKGSIYLADADLRAFTIMDDRAPALPRNMNRYSWARDY